MAKTTKAGVGAFDDPATWVGGIAPVPGDTAVIATPNGNPPAEAEPLFGFAASDSGVVFGALPLPVSSNTVYFDMPGQSEVIDGTTYYFQGVAYSFSYPVPLPPPHPAGNAIRNETLDFGTGNGSLTGAVLEDSSLDAATVANINGPSLWQGYFDNTLGGTIDVGGAFSIDGAPVAQPAANPHGSTSELDLLLSGDGSVQSGPTGALVLSSYLPTTTNTGAINIASGSEMRISYVTGAEDAGETPDGTVRFLLVAGQAAFDNEGTVNVAPGGGLFVYDSGNSNSFALSQFVNDGQILIKGGEGFTTGALFQAALTGSGTITVDGGDAAAAATTLHLNDIADTNIVVRDATVLATDTGTDGTNNTDGAGQNRAIGGSLTFADGKGSLVIDPATGLAAGNSPYLASKGSSYDTPSLNFWNMPIHGFQAGDTIVSNIFIPLENDVLYSYSVGPLAWDAATGTLSVQVVTTNNFTPSDRTTTTAGQFKLAGNYSLPHLFESVTAGSGDYRFQVTITTDEPPCFVAGTRIATPRGAVRVEELTVGALVLTAGGRARPVRWLGSRRVDLARHPAPDRVRPVRVRAGAIARDLPARDLLLSPDHALFLDGALVPVRLLLNGRGIVEERHLRAVTYVHVELASHDILLAEGVPAESYLDTGNRNHFDMGSAVVSLHPDFAPASPDAHAAAGACARLAVDEATVLPIWLRLAERAGVKAATPAVLTTPATLEIVTDRGVIGAVSVQDSRHVFVLPNGAGALRLRSPSARPSAARPWIDDRRRLGVAVAAIRARAGAGLLDVALDDPRLNDGWHAVERDGWRAWRWTDGDACLPIRGAGIIEVRLTGAPVPSHAAPASAAAGIAARAA